MKHVTLQEYINGVPLFTEEEPVLPFAAKTATPPPVTADPAAVSTASPDVKFKSLVDDIDKMVAALNQQLKQMFYNSIRAAVDQLAPSADTVRRTGYAPGAKLPWFKYGIRGFLNKLWHGDHPSNPMWNMESTLTLEQYIALDEDVNMAADLIIYEVIKEAEEQQAPELRKPMPGQPEVADFLPILNIFKEKLVERIRKFALSAKPKPEAATSPTNTASTEPTATPPAAPATSGPSAESQPAAAPTPPIKELPPHLREITAKGHRLSPAELEKMGGKQADWLPDFAYDTPTKSELAASNEWYKKQGIDPSERARWRQFLNTDIRFKGNPSSTYLRLRKGIEGRYWREIVKIMRDHGLDGSDPIDVRKVWPTHRKEGLDTYIPAFKDTPVEKPAVPEITVPAEPVRTAAEAQERSDKATRTRLLEGVNPKTVAKYYQYLLENKARA